MNDEHAFGLLLTALRTKAKRKIKQKDIVTYLPGWTASSYSRLEQGEIAPPFDQLYALYHAFLQAGVKLMPDLRHQFVDYARRRIALQKTYKYRRTDDEWAQLRFQLAKLDGLSAVTQSNSSRHIKEQLLMETEHLVGREAWREETISLLKTQRRIKLLVLGGPSGIGKTSELNWLASYIARQQSHQVVLCDFQLGERNRKPEDALELLIGSILTELGYSESEIQASKAEDRTTFLLTKLEKLTMPIVVLLDHAECILHEHNFAFAPYWESFLSKFLRSKHSCAFILATKQWPGWFGGEQVFVAETTLPSLSQEKSVLLLQQLGLDTVPVSLLQDIYTKVGGIPQCLEWVAALVKQPLYVDDWEAFSSQDQFSPLRSTAKQNHLELAVRRLLAEPHIFGGNLADAVAPLLERIIANQRLSEEARYLLQVLSVSLIPLSQPALEVLCPRGPRPLNELRRASLLVAYPHRAYLLPTVASAVLRRLTRDEIQESEQVLVQAYLAWLQEGSLQDSEKGPLITELVKLLLKQQRLLDVAQILIRYGWMSFNFGYATHLAQTGMDKLQHFDWHKTVENECGGFLLHYLLSPYLGRSIDTHKRAADYQKIHDYASSGQLVLEPPTALHVTHHLITATMSKLKFHEALVLLESCGERLASSLIKDKDLQASMLEHRAWILGTWCENAEEQGDAQTAKSLREETIALYQQCSKILSNGDDLSPLEESLQKKRLARCFNNIGYHLNRISHFDEALSAIEQSLALKEQGYVQVGSLAAAYSEKAEALAGLGRFQEAFHFDQKAHEDIEKSASRGHALSQEDTWIYHVNRGRLYLRIGKINEAEALLQEALPHIPPRRRMYQMFAKNALQEIEQWRQRASSSSHYQIDWRWVDRYRKLASFDSYWWLAHAGPFTENEQQEWDQTCTKEMDEFTRKRLDNLLNQSRDRELAAAVEEQREPRLRYPAIDIEDVRARIAALLELDREIHRDEPNAIVRKLYQGTIEEEVSYLHLIEATFEGNRDQFWQCNLRLNPLPTTDEMNYALSRVNNLLLQGLRVSEIAPTSQQLITFLSEQFQIALNLSSHEEEPATALQKEAQQVSPDPQSMVSPETAKKFFEAILQKSGYEGWQIIIDPHSNGAHVEQGLRHFYLPNSPLSTNKIRHYLSHELAGHVARCIAGERSQFGLLGIHTKNSLETEEGLAVYQDRHLTHLSEEPYDDTGEWIGTLATGLASGIITPPQSFLSLFRFFEIFLLLRRLLKHSDSDIQMAQKNAKRLALTRCLRTFRGVPHLEQPGICYSKDALYLRGLRKIEQAVATDETVLDRLAVGVVALEQLPYLQELGIVVPSIQSLIKLADDPGLESYILSFEDTTPNEPKSVI